MIGQTAQRHMDWYEDGIVPSVMRQEHDAYAWHCPFAMQMIERGGMIDTDKYEGHSKGPWKYVSGLGWS